MSYYIVVLRGRRERGRWGEKCCEIVSSHGVQSHLHEEKTFRFFSNPNLVFDVLEHSGFFIR